MFFYEHGILKTEIIRKRKRLFKIDMVNLLHMFLTKN